MEKPSPKASSKELCEYINYLEDELSVYKDSPYEDSYIALRTKITEWNEELRTKAISLFADKDQKEFDRAHKFFSEQKPYFEQLKYLRIEMGPQKTESADRKLKEGASAEKHIFGEL
jgi:hypothetical protein